MFMAQIEFSTTNAPDMHNAAQATNGLLAAWYHNGQTIDCGEIFVGPDGGIRTWVSIPEQTALDDANNGKWVNRALSELERCGANVSSTEIVGKNTEGDPVCTCEDSTALLLFASLVSTGSPVLCMDCGHALPIYKVPPFESGSHETLRCWNKIYKACDTLWIYSQTGEFFALREMARLDSSLTRHGRAVCEIIEAKMGIPTFYYLDRGKSRRNIWREQVWARERARRCPSCNGEWLLPESVLPFVDFRCDPCRIASNLSP